MKFVFSIFVKDYN